MFNLFRRSRKNYFIGIDFGTSSIKVVELSFWGQRTHLTNYGRVDFNLKGVYEKSKLQSHEAKFQKYLKELFKKMRLKSKSAYASIAGFSGLVALIELPEMKEDELAQAIKFEAYKYIPASLDEVFLSWDIVSKKNVGKNSIIEKVSGKSKKPGKLQILLVAALKEEVNKYEKLIKSSGLEIKTLELEIFSLVRSLIGNDLGNFIIIDMGARASNIVLVEKGTVKINRSVDVGGNEITNTIAESMNISKKRAESLKKQNKDFVSGRERMIVFPSLELIVDETRRIIKSYMVRNKNARIDGIILSGGAAKLKGADTYFSRCLDMRVIVGNPWKKIEFDKKFAPQVEKMGPSFSVALGLALKGVEEYQRR